MTFYFSPRSRPASHDHGSCCFVLTRVRFLSRSRTWALATVVLVARETLPPLHCHGYLAISILHFPRGSQPAPLHHGVLSTSSHTVVCGYTVAIPRRVTMISATMYLRLQDGCNTIRRRHGIFPTQRHCRGAMVATPCFASFVAAASKCRCSQEVVVCFASGFGLSESLFPAQNSLSHWRQDSGLDPGLLQNNKQLSNEFQGFGSSHREHTIRAKHSPVHPHTPTITDSVLKYCFHSSRRSCPKYRIMQI